MKIGPYETGKVYQADCLQAMRELPDSCIQCCITSPPYWGLRDYGVVGQLGLEKTPEEHIEKIIEIFHEVKRVLRKDGTLWLNLGDCYIPQSSHAGGTQYDGLNKKENWQPRSDALKKKKSFGKPKDLMGMPWRIAFALQADGWWLRSDIIWHKPNCMPESVKDRPTRAHEFIFLMTKSAKYYYDHVAIKENMNTYDDVLRDRQPGKLNSVPGRRKMEGLIRNDYNKRNKRDVWTVASKPYKGAHFATFPEDLIVPCVLAGCPAGGIIMDPFMGVGTTGIAAVRNGRDFIGFELNGEYCAVANKRIFTTQRPLFGDIRA